MRIPCALYFCEEVGEATYTANDLTSLLVKPGWRGGFKWAEINFQTASSIRSFVKSSEFLRTGDTSSPPAFQFATGKSLWNVLAEDPGLRRDFDLFMRERREHEERSWHIRYPPVAALRVEELKNDKDVALMVDIGGANGSQLVDFRDQFPELPGGCVLQDMQPPEEPPAPGIEVMKYDFFQKQPVQGKSPSSAWRDFVFH